MKAARKTLAETAAAGHYPGGKNSAGLWQWIIANFPAHSAYVEPFAGSGAVLRRKVPALRSVVCELDSGVAAWWRSLDLPRVEVVNGCGIAWLESQAENLGPDWLVYADPPYLPETRTTKRIYNHELTEADHRRLIAVLKRLRCSVVLSGYGSSLYGSLGWRSERRQFMTRGGLRWENIWCNFELASTAAAVRPGQAAGDNYRERERIKKLVARWRRNFARRPPAERSAILAGLLDQERAGG